MRILVQVKTNSKIESVEKIGNAEFLVRVRTPPIEGKANEKVRKLLAEYLKVSKSSVELISGQKSKKKIFEVI